MRDTKYQPSPWKLCCFRDPVYRYCGYG